MNLTDEFHGRLSRIKWEKCGDESSKEANPVNNAGTREGRPRGC